MIERLRVASADAGLAPLIRRKVILLAVDALLLAGVVIGVAYAKGPLAGYVERTTAFSPGVSTVVLYGIAAMVAAPLIVGIVRVSAAFASLLAYRALPLAAGNRLDYAQAPRQVLMATLQLALVTVSGLLVVVVTGPFVPLGRGAVVLALVVGWLGWCSGAVRPTCTDTRELAQKC